MAYRLESEQITLIPEGLVMTDLSALLPLRRAWGSTPPPARPAECLPLVYGDMRGGYGALWNAVCLDTAAHVLRPGRPPLLALEAGNQVTLYGKDGLNQGLYGLKLCHALQSRPAIATFSQE